MTDPKTPTPKLGQSDLLELTNFLERKFGMKERGRAPKPDLFARLDAIFTEQGLDKVYLKKVLETSEPGIALASLEGALHAASSKKPAPAPKAPPAPKSPPKPKSPPLPASKVINPITTQDPTANSEITIGDVNPNAGFARALRTNLGEDTFAIDAIRSTFGNFRGGVDKTALTSLNDFLKGKGLESLSDQDWGKVAAFYLAVTKAHGISRAAAEGLTILYRHQPDHFLKHLIAACDAGEDTPIEATSLETTPRGGTEFAAILLTTLDIIAKAGGQETLPAIKAGVEKQAGPGFASKVDLAIKKGFLAYCAS